MKNAEFNTKLLEVKLLEIAVRASGTHSQSSANFVKELGITEIVQKIKEEHPELAKALMGEPHSADWTEGYEQACNLIAILGDLAETMVEHFGDSSSGGDFTVRDWTKELTTTAKRLLPDVSGCGLTFVNNEAKKEAKDESKDEVKA